LKSINNQIFFTGNENSTGKIAVPFIVTALFMLTGVAAFVFWYFRRSKLPAPPVSGLCHEIYFSKVLVRRK